MIKFLLGVVVVLALVGGAVQFKATDKDWSLIINKEIALNSVKTGSIKIYNLITDALADAKKSTEETSAPTAETK
ncbi:MAG: hypothetical protein H0A76_02225 [Candidatus Thiodubiliella endoseptemdiera]|uniref:Uncharacterized protein n=1 Tax=Candidatus Thiodubiliella endoseptemdiera TaxID=2738886 RepID=A0A853EZR2_9GAMM|nr:hypothetical protein [Candidatus Thiodubiliella endoseptemdiera]